MITGRISLLVRTVVAILGLAVIASTAAEAGDFTLDYYQYLPNSVRSKIEAYVGKADVSGRRARAPAKPKVLTGATTVTTAPTKALDHRVQFKDSNYAVASAPTLAPPTPPVVPRTQPSSAEGEGL